MLTLINPIPRAEPFDHPEWVFEAKFDGFRAVADTARGRLTSRNGHRMPRFQSVLDLLPKGHVFDGEVVVLDDAGRPLFNELMFGRRRPTYVAFDLLMADGVDLRPLPLRERKARLAVIGKGAESWIALTNGLVGEGCALYRAAVDADLEGIVAKPADRRLPAEGCPLAQNSQPRLLAASRPRRVVSRAAGAPCASILSRRPFRLTTRGMTSRSPRRAALATLASISAAARSIPTRRGSPGITAAPVMQSRIG